MAADQTQKRGFWGAIFRGKSLSKKAKNKDKSKARRPSETGADARSQRPEPQQTWPKANGVPIGTRREPAARVRHPEIARPATEVPPRSTFKLKKKTAPVANGHQRVSFTPLTRWPPTRVPVHAELSSQHAFELIARGAPAFKGHIRAVPHASEQFYALYTTTSGSSGGGSDAVDLHENLTQLMTLRMLGAGHATYPWETLEQPSYAFCFGQLPGTVTLNQWTSMASVLPQAIALRDPGVVPRPMTLPRIFERLMELQSGLEDDDEDLLYKILYKRMLRDPDRATSPHRTLDKQMTDLILVLSRPDWVDFSIPKNQVVTRFIFDGGAGGELYRRFFHQLLLSLELELRIHSRQHGNWAKEKLLRQIPPRIQWGLAVARRWREHVRVDDYGDTPGQVRLRYKLKKRQVKMLKRFAQTMKWPNLSRTMENLRQRDEEFTLDLISSDAFAFFSGLVVPGPTFPFLIMNTLIDLDPDPTTDDLALLSHMHPHCGFQYRSSYTYWSESCIVGRVLAPGCRTAAGWVGPGRPTADLGRSQIARVRSRRCRQRLRLEDVESMGERSDALGPPAGAYPVEEYTLPQPDSRDVIDTVRVELLGLKPVVVVEESTAALAQSGPRLFDATIQFAIDGVSWPLRLMYDVTFVSAWPCADGPHPLFFDYAHERIRVDDIVGVRNWGGLYGPQQGSARSSPAQDSRRGGDEHDDEKVLVVEAFGVSDNEVLARAWCSHWGLGAVVADVRDTCMACAVREAYAATLTVVILIDGQRRGNDGDE